MKKELQKASIKQLKNCDDMHIYVQPIREYIEDLENEHENIMDLLLSIDEDYLYQKHPALWRKIKAYHGEIE